MALVLCAIKRSVWSPAALHQIAGIRWVAINIYLFTQVFWKKINNFWALKQVLKARTVSENPGFKSCIPSFIRNSSKLCPTSHHSIRLELVICNLCTTFSISAQVIIEIVEHHPKITQLREFCYFADTFRRLDYGAKENRKRYGSAAVPEYNLANVRTKVHILHGSNDLLSMDAVKKNRESIQFIHKLHSFASMLAFSEYSIFS